MAKRISKAIAMVCLLCTTFLTVTICAPRVVVMGKEKTHQWEKGMLLDITQRDASRLVNGTSYEKSIWTYIVDDGHYVWKLDRDTNHRDKPLDVTINAAIEFAIEGQKAYLKDESGQEHSLSVESKAIKNSPVQ